MTISHNFRSMPSCFRTCRNNNDYDNEQFCITHKYTWAVILLFIYLKEPDLPLWKTFLTGKVVTISQ